MTTFTCNKLLNKLDQSFQGEKLSINVVNPANGEKNRCQFCWMKRSLTIKNKPINPKTSLNHQYLPPHSVLLVDRQESRPAEWLARKFFGAFSAVCSTAMSIPIQAVAKAMAANALLQPETKTEILENKDIASLGKSAGKWEEEIPGGENRDSPSTPMSSSNSS